MRPLTISLLMVVVSAMTCHGESCSTALERLEVPALPDDCVLAPGNAVYIIVKGECFLWRPIPIRPDGKVTMPLIGDVQAAYLTPAQLESMITEMLRSYVYHPVVNVKLADTVRKKYYVHGAVPQPGEYPLKTPVTVLEAIGKATGPDRRVPLNEILVERGEVTFKLKYAHLLTHPEENILLQNGDDVFFQ
jgi:polysaccharide export outer membrane protein